MICIVDKNNKIINIINTNIISADNERLFIRGIDYGANTPVLNLLTMLKIDT